MAEDSDEPSVALRTVEGARRWSNLGESKSSVRRQKSRRLFRPWWKTVQTTRPDSGLRWDATAGFRRLRAAPRGMSDVPHISPGLSR